MSLTEYQIFLFLEAQCGNEVALSEMGPAVNWPSLFRKDLKKLILVSQDLKDYVAEVPSLMSIAVAAKLLNSVIALGIPPDCVDVAGDGGVGFGWIRDTWYADVEVANNGDVFLFHRRRGKQNDFCIIDPDNIDSVTWEPVQSYFEDKTEVLIQNLKDLDISALDVRQLFTLDIQVEEKQLNARVKELGMFVYGETVSDLYEDLSIQLAFMWHSFVKANPKDLTTDAIGLRKKLVEIVSSRMG